MTDIEKLKRAVELLQDFCAKQQVQLMIINHKLAELQKKDEPADVTVA